MPYNFILQKSKPARLSLLVRSNVDDYTLTAEFTRHEIFAPRADWIQPTEPVILAVQATSQGNIINIDLTADQISQIGSAYYRIRAVKADVDIYIESGRITYRQNLSTSSSIDIADLTFDPATQEELDAVGETFAPLNGVVTSVNGMTGAVTVEGGTGSVDALHVLVYSGGTYPARPAVSAGLVRYLGPVEPTDTNSADTGWLPGDEWVDNS